MSVGRIPTFNDAPHLPLVGLGDGDTEVPIPEIWWDRPGTGERTKTNCGMPVMRDGITIGRRCPHHREVQVARQTCKRPDCGEWECVMAWTRREAARAEVQFQAMETPLREAGYRVGTGPRHWITSPPQRQAKISIETEVGYDSLRADAIRKLVDAGIHGGCLIFHAERLTDNCRSGPHFHALAYGWSIPTETFQARNPDWILKNRGARITIKGTISYLLDHVGLMVRGKVPVRKNRISWFGTMATRNRRKVGEKKIREPVLCKTAAPSPQTRIGDEYGRCGAHLEEVEVESGIVRGLAYQVVKVGIYVATLVDRFTQHRLKAD